jgi:hypothetical protein
MSTLFSLGGLPAHPQNPYSWRTSLYLLVRLLSYGLSGLGGPTRNIKFPPAKSVRSLRTARPQPRQGGDIPGGGGRPRKRWQRVDAGTGQRPKPWKVMMMMMMMMKFATFSHVVGVSFPHGNLSLTSENFKFLSQRKLRLKCDGTRAETRFRLSGKRTSSFQSAGASVQSTTGNRGARISGSNAGYTMFRGSVKGTGHPLHSPVSPSLPLSCVTVCHHISTGVYNPFVV